MEFFLDFKFIKNKKPGRQLLTKLTLPNSINTIVVIGNLSKIQGGI